MIKILFAIYLAFLLSQFFPFAIPLSPLALFVILIILVFLFLSQAKVFKKSKKFSSRETALLIANIGLLLTIILSFSRISLFDRLPPVLYQLFVSQYSLFGWLVAPLVILALFKNKDKK